ncbi:putative response regulator phosphotransferase [Scheffersomyces coipomensis]|uniref:putative response regulator phosphotransferase n=1 Tax=Scheffersomyces coipomensis TaxID=1788519 RepID=UPI00315DCF8B
MGEDKRQKLQDTGLVDWSVFSELLVMDEDEEGFSLFLFKTFVDQVIETFQSLDKNLISKDLNELSDLGHYLKGSAAAIGLIQISSQCERIQNYGHKMNFDNFDINESSSSDPPASSSSSSIPASVPEPISKLDSSAPIVVSKDESSTPIKDSITIQNNVKPLPQPPTSSIPSEDSDDFWIILIKDALHKARDAFAESRVALNEFFDVEY